MKKNEGKKHRKPRVGAWKGTGTSKSHWEGEVVKREIPGTGRQKPQDNGPW